LGIPLGSTAPGHRASDLTAGSPNHLIHNPIEIGTAQSPTESYKMTHYSPALPNMRFFLFPQELPRLLLPAGQSLPPVLRPAGCLTGATSPPGSHTSRASCQGPLASGSGWSTSSSIQRRPDGQSFPSRRSRETDPLMRRVHDPGTDSKTTAFGLTAEFRTDTIHRDLQHVEHRSLSLDIQASWCVVNTLPPRHRADHSSPYSSSPLLCLPTPYSRKHQLLSCISPSHTTVLNHTHITKLYG